MGEIILSHISMFNKEPAERRDTFAILFSRARMLMWNTPSSSVKLEGSNCLLEK